ncbi:MAG: polyprenol monophosphomannose synthase [Ignavibacteriaceae bacterium]|jgi:dolichol-phosphate mannosyltransferase|nr:polyprenol monophosphomannose synthase [Ignavibacteriaceae bacterium]
MKAIILIPTYNEIDNIQKLVPFLLSKYPEVNILVIDDNSPDGTHKWVKEFSEKDSRVNLIKRAGKMGLGTAYVEGYKYMLANRYDVAVQMDADYSHNPNDIQKFLSYINDFDLVIGSRYIKGVNVVNWPISRLLLSYFANMYTRIITGLPIMDGTGGFKCFRSEVLRSINLDKIKSNGYSFQIEMNYIAWKKGFKIFEFPIVFTDRFQGTSKMSKKIVHEAIFMVWKLRFRSLIGRLN